jgi:hypothetical protein
MYESFKSDSKLGELDDQGIALISSKSKWTFADARGQFTAVVRANSQRTEDTSSKPYFL